MFEKGSRVKFVHTGDKGTVTGSSNRGMVYVMLEDGMEIPVYPEDIKILLPEEDVLSTSSTDNIASAKKDNHFKKGKIRKGRYATDKGFLICFEAYTEDDGTIDSYDIFLINDTKSDIVFSLKMKCLDFISKEFSDKIEANSGFDIGVLFFEELNDSPRFDITYWQVTTMGLGKEHKISIVLKGKQFFKKAKDTPILNKTTHVYEIVRKFKDEENTKKESLADYTKRHAEERQKEELIEAYVKINNVKEKAEFSDELDLHIEVLTDDHDSMSNAEKLLYQIRCFEEYLEEAIRIGFQKVYIIHGIGKGRLRDNITAILIRNPHVKTFKNEYNEKYGFGATEVIFL